MNQVQDIDGILTNRELALSAGHRPVPALIAAVRTGLRVPVLAPLIGNRLLALVLAATGLLQISLVSLGLPAWLCPTKTLLGVPCPGCGLSTAIVALARGDWHGALSAHLFAPAFLFTILFMFFVCLLPDSSHQKTVGAVARLEQRTGIILVSLLCLLPYWVLRLLKLF